MEKNVVKEESKKLVSFAKVSENQTFCTINVNGKGKVTVAEIAKKDGKFQVNYMSSKLSDEIRKEIAEKYEKIVSGK